MRVGAIIELCWGLCGAIGVAACSPDPRCSLANCQTMLDCQIAIYGVPDEPQLCPREQARPLASYCIQACESENAGAFVACAADSFSGSCPGADGGFPSSEEIGSTCEPGDLDCGTDCKSCQSKCYTSLELCDLSCPDAGVCLDCEYQCSLAAGTCANGCPRT